MEIVVFRTENTGRPRRDSCCREIKTRLMLPRGLLQRHSAIYHRSNHFLLQNTLAFFSPRFVSVWPAPEVVNGIFEVCPLLRKIVA